MPRMDINRSAEMEVFVRAVDLGGFSAAASEFGMTPSAVSKLVARLEARLSARLLNRSTRRLELTPEGKAFYDRAVRILAEITEAEREASAGAAPRGHLRVNSNIPFGRLHLLPLLPAFLAAYPGITLDLVLTDTVVDLMRERADVAIRVGPLRDSGLIARKIGTSRLSVVASPAYLARHGTPLSIEDLPRHRGIGWTFQRMRTTWPFKGGVWAAPPTQARASDGETARALAVGGVGLARLGLFHVSEDIEAGRLIPVLEGLNPGDEEDLHAVYMGQGGPLPARVRAFIDFLAERVRL
ncbi:LysR family transcriptional regulator [Roseococcus sp. YIM B11640]|uniref:LysR family transcriptional regulator n=1 Tax=Roseococcus sp. YIM B11640 TaxID=3133973 RepID=UPI003C7C0C87